jgi:hypothetical protein
MAETRKFEKLTIDQFLDVLGRFPFRRRINAVHMHHTWRPRHADYRRDPEGCIEGMWRFHTQQRGFSDIAQHITIAPDGTIWTGRNWDLPPASATGHNGNNVAGPFMFEMIGDFDQGGDPFQDPQRSVVLQVIAHLQRRFRLPVEALRFHNQMSTKSCPGACIDYDQILSEIRTLRASLDTQPERRDVGVFGENANPDIEITRQIVGMLGVTRSAPGPVRDEGDVPHEDMTYEETLTLSAAELSPTRGLFDRDLLLTAEQKDSLRPHVLNLRFGAFSKDGILKTTQADADRVFEEDLEKALGDAKSEGRKLRILFYAHGGLVKESAGLYIALNQVEFWKRNNIYPIFFVWETGLLETIADILKQAVAGTRGFVGDMWDKTIETLARLPGKRTWTQMKRSAEVSVLTGGGALYAAQKTGAFFGRNRDHLEIHAVGHSAGSIFHAHFLPCLLENGVDSIRSLHFLAPAVNVPTFQSKLQPLIGNKIQHLTMFTMTRSYELEDTTGPYRKSLLYLVHDSFEDPDGAPILGVEENIREDRDLSRFFGLLGGNGGSAEIVFSVSGSNAPLRSRSTSVTHGGFDNDQATMNSVARRILDIPDSTEIFGFPARTRALVAAELSEFARSASTPAASPVMTVALSTAPAAPAPPVPAPTPQTATPVATFTAGRKQAVCVGINAYQSPYELSGCVADARNWGGALQALGFQVDYLLDEQATYNGILNRLRELVQTSSSGDLLVFQYAGHGTTLKDVSGDEVDGTDEAFCPVDMNQGSFIIDDDLREIFKSIPDGVNLTCFIDCCHSGTITRLVAGLSPLNAQLAGSKPRFIRPTAEMEAAHRAFRAGRRSAPALAGPDEMREVLFSACLPEEVAYETGGNGDFTSRALPLLAAAAGTLTHKAFQDRVTSAFGASARQHPNLDCAPAGRDRVLLAPLASAPARVAMPATTATGAAVISGSIDWDSVARTLRATADLIEENH